MEFSGLFFLSAALPVVLLAYFLIPDVGRRNVLLILASLLLYGVWQPVYVPLLLMLCRLNFSQALKIKKDRRATVLVPIAFDLGVLAVLKYADPFLLGFVSAGVEWLNGYGLKLQCPDTLTPLGISFFTLTAISYLLDVYRGKYPAERSFRHFLLHMVMFPKLFQGPLVRYDQTVPYLKERREHYRQSFDGLVRFCTGLGKKVLLADCCGRMIAELVSAKSDQALVGSWLVAVLFFFQIHYDFSGCCDMAVGLGRIFGFKFPENFNLPYTALSVTEFCQRWNLTLGSFFRDYVHDPLCQKRESLLRRFVALLLTCVLAALWHGAGVPLLLWGLYLAAVILIEKLLEGFLTDLPYFLRHVLTVLALLLGWVIFRAEDVQALADALKAMIGNGGLNVAGDGERFGSCLPLIAACWFGVTAQPRKLRRFWRNAWGVSGKRSQTMLMRCGYLASCVVYIAVLLWWCISQRIEHPALPSIFMNL